MRDNISKKLAAILTALILAFTLTSCASAQESSATSSPASSSSAASTSSATQTSEGLDFHNPGADYKLKQVVVLSRHNMRSALTTSGSIQEKATPHQWINWTSNAGELTMRGSALETMMGTYMRKWLESEGLFPANYQPADGKVRIYANGKQRTIATAKAFSSGFLPVANMAIETHVDYETMDPVYTPAITFCTESYQVAALNQMCSLAGAPDIPSIASSMAESYALIEEVVDYTHSEGYLSGELARLNTTDTQVALEQDQEPAMTGSIATACQVADALILQYYELPDTKEAAFGHNLSREQWACISAPKDFYINTLYSAPLVACNVAHPLLQEIGSEMDAEGREFTFLCGHDSNVASVLAALGVEDYSLPGAIEAKTPIGCRVVFERWENAQGEQFGRVRMLYQTVEELREGTMLAGTVSPASVDLSLNGLQKNADGLYSYNDLRACVANATAEYDHIAQKYTQ